MPEGQTQWRMLFFPSGVNLRIERSPHLTQRDCHCIKGQVVHAVSAEPRCERALLSIRREFKD